MGVEDPGKAISLAVIGAIFIFRPGIWRGFI